MTLTYDHHQQVVSEAARRGRTGRDPLAHSHSSGTLSEIPRQTNAEPISVHAEVIMDGVLPREDENWGVRSQRRRLLCGAGELVQKWLFGALNCCP
jgi:hypothetical protein